MSVRSRGPQSPAPGKAALSLTALGVVYGDIGTSPLYALRECFFGDRAIEPSVPNVLGVLSLVTWSLVLVISLKYLVFVLRADYDGEGGILALMELVKKPLKGRLRKVVLVLGLFGVALLYGDGIITPAISVLSAAEGLRVATDAFDAYVVPLAIGILTGLFLLQRLGAGGVGKVFGPVMMLWFAALAVSGAYAIWQQPGVLTAVNPVHAATFFTRHGLEALVILGLIFLVVTGGEALYADLGQFGTAPIRLGWYCVVLPSLLLNYLGQGALLLTVPEGLTNPFYELFPDWLLYPMVALATGATVIASQAIISGAFSVTLQSVQLGYLPRLEVRHTSSMQRGQIYVPAVNWLLLGAILTLVLVFRESGSLAGAYGTAITAIMLITTLLFMSIARRVLGWPLPIVAACLGVFLAVDLMFVAANLSKIPTGGWLPLLVAGSILLLMTTWRRGQQLERRIVRDRAEPLTDFLKRHGGGYYRRVPGQAVYLADNEHGTPHVLEYNLRHNRALHNLVVIYTAKFVRSPYVRADERLRIEKVRDDIVKIVAYYGFMEAVDVQLDLKNAAQATQIDLDPERVTYFVGDEIVLARKDVGMPRWRAWLYALMQRNAQRATLLFNLPPTRVIEIGTRVPV